MSNMVNNIKQQLMKILKEDMDKDISKLTMEMWDKNLVGIEIGFSARDLLFLLNKIEDSFSIRIPNEFLIEKKFTTLNNIISEIIRVKEVNS